MDMSNIKICIPSYKRPNDVRALRSVSPELQQKYYWLCVRDEEIDEYKQNYPHCNILNLGGEWKPSDSIGETRQRINEKMTGKILVIDDDVEFSKTRIVEKIWKDEPFHYMRYDKDINTNDILEEMLEYLDGLMDKYPYGSVRAHGHPRDGRKFMPYRYDQVGIWCVWFNLDEFDTNVISYRRGPNDVEDVYMSLRFYELGYQIPQVSLYCIKKSKGTHSQKGGCSEITDRGIKHDLAVDWLVEKYPLQCHSRPSHLYGGTKTVRVKFKRKQTQNLF